MQPSLFLKNKITRQLNCNGIIYVFNHKKEDKFHNKIDGDNIEIKGIYHEQNSYQSETRSDASITHTKPIPMILCLYEDVGELSSGDTVMINDIEFRITAINDIQKYKVVADISLEEVI